MKKDSLGTKWKKTMKLVLLVDQACRLLIQISINRTFSIDEQCDLSRLLRSLVNGQDVDKCELVNLRKFLSEPIMVEYYLVEGWMISQKNLIESQNHLHVVK